MSESEPERRSTSTLRGWAWTTLVAGSLASVLPTFDDADPIIAGGFSTVMMLLVMFVPLLWGTIDPADRVRLGFITGSAIFIGGFFLLVTATVVFFKRSFGEYIELGPGIAPLIATVAASWMTVFVSLRSRLDPDGPTMSDGARWTGAIAGAAVTVGIMLPPSDSGLTVKDLNFSFDDAFLQLSWLVFLAVAGGTVVVGFIDGKRWGLGVAIAGGIPVTWIVANALFELERPEGEELGFGGVLRQEVHPLLVVAVLVGGAAAIVAYKSLEAVPLVDGPLPGTVSVEEPEPGEPAPPGELVPPVPDQAPQPADGAATGKAAPPRTDENDGEAIAQRAEPRTEPHVAQFGLRSMGNRTEPPPGSASEPDPFEHTITAESSPFGPVVTLSGGRRHVVLGTLIIGRDPTSLPTDDYPILVAMGDQDRRVSKTHLAVGRSPSGQLWVEDRHSTNGVLVTPDDGTAFALDPGRRTHIEPGTTLLFGETTAHVEASNTG